jgi:hypothetical protein
MRVNQITAVLVMVIIAAAFVAMQSLPQGDEMNTFQQPMLPPSSTIYTGNITLPKDVLARFDTTAGSAAVTATLPGSPSVGDACGMALINYADAVSTTAFTLTADVGSAAEPISGTGIGYSVYDPIGSKTGVQSKSVNVHIADAAATATTITVEIGLSQSSSAILAGTLVTFTSQSVPQNGELILSINIGDMLDTLVADGTYNGANDINLLCNITANSSASDVTWTGVSGTHASVAMTEEAPLLRYINSSRNGNLLDGGTTEDQLTAIGDAVMYQFLGSSLGWKRYPYMVSE